jgi:hypothetical protein
VALESSTAGAAGVDVYGDGLWVVAKTIALNKNL